MNIKDYIDKSERTDSEIFNLQENDKKLMHGMIGLSGENGELLDALKKHIFYGQELDIKNIKEEIGDVMWYIALICRTLNFDLENIMDENINKLQKRYPEKFTKELSIERLDKKEE